MKITDFTKEQLESGKVKLGVVPLDHAFNFETRILRRWYSGKYGFTAEDLLSDKWEIEQTAMKFADVSSAIPRPRIFRSSS